MFEKLVIFLYFLSTVKADSTRLQSKQTSVPLSTPPPDVSSVPDNIAVETKSLQSQQAVIGNSPLGYTSQNAVQYLDKSGQYGYLGNLDYRYVVSPTAVDITSPSIVVPTPGLNVQPIQQIIHYASKPSADVNYPQVQYVTLPVGYAGNSGLQLRSKNVHETANVGVPSGVYAPSKIFKYPIGNFQQVAKHPALQYLANPESEVGYTKQSNPFPAKNIPIETQHLVTTNPTTSLYLTPKNFIQYDISRPLIQYVTTPATYPVPRPVSSITQAYTQGGPFVKKQIAVPVIYNTKQAPEPQYVVINNYGQSAPGDVKYKTPVAVQTQPIPVPVAYPQSDVSIRYKYPVSNAKTKQHASAGSQPSVSRYGYSRALTYSPASAVSSVRFNGLGVSYAW